MFENKTGQKRGRHSPVCSTLQLQWLPLDTLRWSTLVWELLWPVVSGAGQQTAALHSFITLVCYQFLNVSADVRAGFIAL